MRLIINADDFGMNENVNKAILYCFDKGLISQATLMVNMPECDHAVQLGKETGILDRIGLHLNLSEGSPLTDDIKQFRCFCSEDGLFNNAIRMSTKYRFCISTPALRAVRKEILAQMKKFRDFGLRHNHYDSHGHVGAYWPITRIALSCAKEYGFRTTRQWINLSSNSSGAPISLIKRAYAFVDDCFIDIRGLKRTSFFGYSWDVLRNQDLLQQNVDVEVMCHPCYRDGTLQLSHKGELMDWKTPINESLHPLLKAHNGNLITYADL